MRRFWAASAVLTVICAAVGTAGLAALATGRGGPEPVQAPIAAERQAVRLPAGGVPEPSQGQVALQEEARSLPEGVAPQEVSRRQYRIMLRQCRYANTKALQEECLAEVQQRYTVGAFNPSLDCRTYSSITVCGELKLTPEERQCVREAVRQGMSYRRAEVECYAFR
ncbi:hypothetical protein TBS_21140 [Thermobispora bispora]|uniref:Uncharacterized protein n=1 Tax=Thermobispora bispora (strain ATCC 19993 / DSM 43833 / CBS 139.67 / JCM 10125 / KCTC 9307 / NBRC 14880 / R51) TaxID=469371 RepID=D6Y3K3_THEBD|nr:hypothetical protein [Thermobispora bispora]ADG87032.1 hypothetical protein Tbis_0301 [Thermobispora bispora DSM 43833]MDI9581497.1 hypothetical protein [Thermobispora sp.]